MEQYTTLKCKFETYSKTSNPNLMNVKLRVMHDGENKKTKVSLEAIKEAEETLRNTPILARVLDDGSDFNEHDTKLERVNGKYKLKYLEKPIGVIGYDSEITYEEEDERTYINATGYIWTRYSQDAVEIIKNAEQKGVSMEIQILEGQLNEDDVYEVTKFVFTGVTVLGDHIESAMYDTYLETYSVMKDYKEELKKIYKEIYSLQNNDKEVIDSMTKNVKDTKDNKEDVKVDPNQTEDKADEKVEDTQEADTPVEPETNSTESNIDNVETYSLSVDDLYRMINKVLETEKKEMTDWDGEQYLVPKYWIETILPMDKIVVLSEHGNWGEYYGVPFEVSGDSIQLNMDSMVGYVREWREKKSGEEVMTFSLSDEENKHAMEKYSKVKEDLKEATSKLKELENYKAEKDKEELEAKVEEVTSEFALEESEIAEVKEEVLNGNIDLEQYTKELYCLVGMKSLKSKEKYSVDKKVDKVGFIGLENYSVEEKDEKPYGDLFEKYGNN